MRNPLLPIAIVTLAVLYASLFIVQEGQRSIILRFGKVLRDDNNNPLICNPGLHVKIPFIETVKNFDARIHTVENQADHFITTEKQDLIIDSYIKWRISNFSRYYLATSGGDISQAEVLLKRKFSDRLRLELGQLDVRKIVTDSHNCLMNNVCKTLNKGISNTDKYMQATKINSVIIPTSNQTERDINNPQMLMNSNSITNLGIEIIDARIKQINLPTAISNSIYQRIRAEREALARYLRSRGREKAEKLRAAADYEVTRTLAEAKRQALIIRGEADAEIAKLYADAFSKDPEFYTFIRSLRAYENSFNKKTNVVVMSLESDFFRFMKLPKDNIVKVTHNN